MGIFLNDHGLEEEVLKHGSHNQSSHGRKGSGGGGSSGAGGGSASKPNSSVNQANPDTNSKLSDAIDKDALGLIEEIDALSRDVTRQATRAPSLVDARKLSNAQGDLQMARSALMPLAGIKNNGEKIKKLNRAADKILSASKTIDKTNRGVLSRLTSGLSMDAADIATGYMVTYVGLQQKYSG